MILWSWGNYQTIISLLFSHLAGSECSVATPANNVMTILINRNINTNTLTTTGRETRSTSEILKCEIFSSHSSQHEASHTHQADHEHAHSHVHRHKHNHIHDEVTPARERNIIFTICLGNICSLWCSLIIRLLSTIISTRRVTLTDTSINRGAEHTRDSLWTSPRTTSGTTCLLSTTGWLDSSYLLTIIYFILSVTFILSSIISSIQ